jgi:uncharacterized surface protein with fasciclin (FAS1) repeats
MVFCAVAMVSIGCAKSHQFTDTSNTVYALASSYPEIGLFITMTETSELDATLRESEPVTVLAPNNRAISVLGSDRVRFLMSPEGSTELGELVKVHVFPGAFSAEDVARGKLPASLNGNRVAGSKASDGTPRVGGTGRIIESMKGSNGFLHVIDTVIR